MTPYFRSAAGTQSQRPKHSVRDVKRLRKLSQAIDWACTHGIHARFPPASFAVASSSIKKELTSDCNVLDNNEDTNLQREAQKQAQISFVNWAFGIHSLKVVIQSTARAAAL